MSNQITDWEIELGFNTKKVDKGLRDLDKKFKKFNSKLNLTIGSKVGGGVGGRAQKQGDAFRPLSSNVRQITPEQRFVQDRGIDRAIATTNAGINALRGRTDKDSIALTNKLREEQKKLIASQQKLSSAVNATSMKYIKLKHEIKDSFSNVKQLTRGVKELSSATKKANPILSGFKNSIKGFVVGSISAFAIANLGRSIFETTKKMDSLRASMLAASGDANAAKEDFEFIRESSIMLGRDLFTSAKGFQQIGTAMRAANFEASEIREVFLAASESSTAFGISTEDTAGVMRAFSQMASKGSIQAEELRGQLGDRLFGAFQEAAKAMGVTTDELNKMLKAGQVASKEFMIPFAKQLRKTVRETGALAAGLKTVVAAQNRFKTSLTDLNTKISDRGGKDIFLNMFESLTSLVELFEPFAAVATKGISLIVEEATNLLQIVTAMQPPVFEILDGLIGWASETKKAGEQLSMWERLIFRIKGAFHLFMAQRLAMKESIEDFFSSSKQEVSMTAKANAGTNSSVTTNNNDTVINVNGGDTEAVTEAVNSAINGAAAEF